jgi:hypothetical protein
MSLMVKFTPGLKDQSLAINEHEAELESLHKKMSELEIRLESQEQYFRRTSTRFLVRYDRKRTFT